MSVNFWYRPSRDSSDGEEKRKKRTPVRYISDDAYHRYKRSVDVDRFPPNVEEPRPVSSNNENFRENCTGSKNSFLYPDFIAIVQSSNTYPPSYL